MATAPQTPSATRAGSQPLIDAALEIVAEHGVAGVTVRAVAERAGVSPGTVSYHFASADDLLVQALESGATQTAQMLERLALDLQRTDWSQESWIRAFAAALGHHIETHRAAHLACMELQLLAARRPECAPTAVKIQLAYARVARMAAVAHDAPDPDGAAVRITALVSGLVLGELVYNKPGVEDRLAATLIAAANDAELTI